MGVEWGLDKLIRTAQAFDRKASRHRDGERMSGYASSRRLAFTARKYARYKKNNGNDN